jgi:hypothetical protein
MASFSSGFASGFDAGASSPVNADPVREITAGPPMRGAPWAVRVPPVEGSGQFGTGAPALPSPTVYAPELTLGPPLRGAPWSGQRLSYPGPLEMHGPAPIPPPPPVYAPEVTAGPPMRGAPWTARPPVAEAAWTAGAGGPLPGTPGGAEVLTATLSFLPRVQARDDPRRLGRFSEKMSILVNSLLGKGQIVQTGPTDFELNAGSADSVGEVDGGTF